VPLLACPAVPVFWACLAASFSIVESIERKQTARQDQTRQALLGQPAVAPPSESCFTFIGRSLERWRLSYRRHTPLSPQTSRVPGAVGETDLRRHKPRRTATLGKCVSLEDAASSGLLRLREDQHERLAVAAFTSHDVRQAVVLRGILRRGLALFQVSKWPLEAKMNRGVRGGRREEA
jgi:hypothetical protein